MLISRIDLNTLRIVSALVAVFACSAESHGYELSEFTFQERILTDAYSDRYASQAWVTKKDIFIIGDKIRIDTPILSNGGDVVIVGGEVVIAAPIDTRIYLDHSNYFPPNGACRLQSWALQNVPSGQAAYRDYYLKTMVWDSTRRWWHLSTAASFPELPQGHTTDFCPGERLSGTAAPTDAILRANTKSGNITIISASVRFCDECLPASEAEYAPETVPNYPPQGSRGRQECLLPRVSNLRRGSP